jgi:hypothetical protein
MNTVVMFPPTALILMEPSPRYADRSGRHVLRHELSFACSNTGVAGSNPARGIVLFLLLFCVCVVLCR